MRNQIFKVSLLVAVGYMPVLGCSGGNSEDGGEIGNGGSNGNRGGKGNGGTAGVIPTNGGTGASSGSGGSVTDDTACISESRTGARAVAALYFMVDISGSMHCPVPEQDPNEPCMSIMGDPGASTRWTASSQAFNNFFNSPATNGIWAGIGFFSGESCDPGDYGPEVEIAPLPGNAMALVNAVNDQEPNGFTPTVPSLTAAIDHTRDWVNDHPEQQGVVVYATDGYPRGCEDNNTIDDAVGVAADGLDGTPSIHTYVLAIGPNLSDLNRVAVAGGTNAAIAINTGMDVSAQLIAALNQIRDDVVVDCAYSIPPPPAGQSLDFNAVNVRITTGSGDEINVGKDDPSDSACDGWQYSPDMTQVILCGDACDAVQNDAGASLDVLFGCQTTIQPPVF